MNIVVDGMGSDFCPTPEISGCIMALQEHPDLHITITGKQNLIQQELNSVGFTSHNLSIHPTTQIVEMTDKPSSVYKKKKDSSLVTGIKLVQSGKADAFVSAGNTGAILSTSLILLGRIEGVRRPAVAIYLPVYPHGVVLCDAGANINIKPHHLLQFAVMASQYMEHVHGIKNPRIGLLNIGEEDSKGTDLYVKAHKLLNKSLPTFKGNIEGRYILNNIIDVIVCDGFLGNNILKFAEGWVSHITEQINRKIKTQVSSPEEAEDIKRIFSEVMSEYDYEEYGGVPLLGVNGVCVICHGSSPSRAIKNGILEAKKSVEENLVTSIQNGIHQYIKYIETQNV